MNKQMSQVRILLSGATVALLTTHQVDAGYQEEWRLFGVPGGIDFFLLFNFVAVGFLLSALIQNAIRSVEHVFWRFFIPATGLVTVLIHSLFALQGRPEFTGFSSVLILGLVLVTSTTELALWCLMRMNQKPDRA
ncbi:MAG: DUF6713 family protein [Oligoflexia bacterium]